MKKKVILIGIGLISILFCLVLYPIGRSIYINYFVQNDGGVRYEKTWITNDNKVKIVNNQKIQMFMPNVYQGIYNFNNQEIEVELYYDIDRTTLVLKEDYEKHIFSGKSEHNIFNDTVIVYVSEVNPDISDYKVGDVVIFSKKE